ncbi:MAG: IPT/TIG domain-containing protein [Candidatus Manganitrophus sp.]|nr:MAG: IPT/TIG domain-containing protein [Candidatus Manganitrophus sp.]
MTYRWRAAAGTLSASGHQSGHLDRAIHRRKRADSGGGVERRRDEGDRFRDVLVSVSPTGPIITSVNPSEAKAGNEIRITGAGFGTGEGGSRLIVGGVTASGILSWNETEIRALIPEGASTGSVKVMIGGVESSPGTLVVLWEKENPENVPLSTAVNEQLFPQMVSDGAAGAIVVWADLRNGLNTDVYAQRVNGSGAVLWAADGVPIAAAANNQSVPQLVSDGAGGAIIAWEDNRTGTSDIYAQRVNRDGIAQWAENGIPVTAAANAQLSPQVIPDGSGGAILVWLDFRNGGTPDLFVQRINGDGAAQWGADGIPLSLGGQRPTISPSDFGRRRRRDPRLAGSPQRHALRHLRATDQRRRTGALDPRRNRDLHRRQ